MSENIGNLVTTEEFSEFYFNRLKEKLNLTDINLNRLGFVGFFIELLGNVQYDVKGYYNYLFNEAFPISATDNTNLLYHSSVFGYSPDLAVPAEIIGSFNIEPLLSNIINVDKRELLLQNISFVIDNLEYRLDSNYKIIYTKALNSSYYNMNVEILYKNLYDIVPVLYSNSKVKTVGLLQYSEDISTFGTSNYSFGTHFIYDVKIEDYLYELKVEVELERNSKIYEVFKTLPIKEFADGNSNVVFYSLLPGNTLRLQFGSGIKGSYIPSRSVRLTIKTTKGEKGNITQQNISLIKGTVNQYDYKLTDPTDPNSYEIIVSSISNYDGGKSYNASKVLTLDITNGIGGKNPSTNDELREKLLKYIQTRENLVSDTDFHNNLKTYSKDSEILFKKTEISENIIYLYGRILNKYLYPIYTTTETILKEVFESDLKINNNKKYIVNPTFNMYGKEFSCPFYFKYNTSYSTYDGYIYYEYIDCFPSVFPIINLNDIPKDLFITLEYDKINDKTRIYIKTKTTKFDSIDQLKIFSQLLNINNIILNKTANFENDYFYYDYSGVIDIPVSVTIKFTINGLPLEFLFYSVQNVFNQIQSLRLKTYIKNGIKYMMNVPLIYKEEYDKDPVYYTNIIKSLFDNMNLKENRMISDEVQFRFLNTYCLQKQFSVGLLKQKYDIDLVLPFKLNINLTFSRDEVITQKININTIVDNIRLTISKYLVENTTGLHLNFYRSKIADICHNFEGIKSVKVILTDNNDQSVPESSIETVDKTTFIDKVDKMTYLNYTPIFWWFDINNLNITTTLL